MVVGIEASHANKSKRTGVEEYAWQVIQNLKKIIPLDTKVILYSQTTLLPGLVDLPPNWSAKVLPWKFGKGWSQVRLSWEFFKNPPDVFFAPGQLVPLICPKNTITTIHDSAFMVYPDAYSFLGRQYLKLMNRLVVAKSKFILTPSEFSKQELIRLYGVKSKKILVTPLGYDASVYRTGEKDDAVLQKIGINKKFFLSLGRLETKKNTDGIIRAFDKFRKTHDASLVLVGAPGVGYDAIQLSIDASPNRQDIILPGWMDKSEIVALIRSAEAFLFPSRYEGFGIPVLEAMATGCPVIASRGNSLAEVGGESAIYAEAENIESIASAMDQVFDNPEKRQNMINSGLARVQEFSWEKTAEMTWEVLSEAGK